MLAVGENKGGTAGTDDSARPFCGGGLFACLWGGALTLVALMGNLSLSLKGRGTIGQKGQRRLRLG